MGDTHTEVEATSIPCPFVCANGRCCTGVVYKARGYGPKRGDFFTARENVRKYRLWCSEKEDHAGSARGGWGKERMEFYPGQLAPDVEDALWAKGYMDQLP